MPRISLENAARDLGGIVDRVKTRNASFELIIEGEVVARIVSAQPRKTVKVGDLDAVFANLPALAAGDAAHFINDLDTLRKETITPEPEWD